MKLAACCIATLLFCSPAIGQGFPATYQATNVAADDVLNVRVAPDPRSDILGTYDPDRTNIEVLHTSADGKWGYVAAQGDNGWVNMTYLSRLPDRDPTIFPRPMSCHGSEPFWTIKVTPEGSAYRDPDTYARHDLSIMSEQGAPNGAMAVFQQDLDRTHTLIVRQGYCSDGMSERQFGWAATWFFQSPDGNYARPGCCTMDFDN